VTSSDRTWPDSHSTKVMKLKRVQNATPHRVRMKYGLTVTRCGDSNRGRKMD
jgi:hypothetical protein